MVGCDARLAMLGSVVSFKGGMLYADCDIYIRRLYANC